jgi:hypothetical protein
MPEEKKVEDPFHSVGFRNIHLGDRVLKVVVPDSEVEHALLQEFNADVAKEVAKDREAKAKEEADKKEAAEKKAVADEEAKQKDIAERQAAGEDVEV